MDRRALIVLCLLVLATALAGCGSAPGSGTGQPRGHVQGQYKVGPPYQIDGVWYYPHEDWSYDETGIASWYGEAFNGKLTANGEIFDLNGLSAAHRTLPMPCVVQVTNLENGRVLKVRVNDRGPFAHGRIIDLSRRSAQLLGFEGKGTARVRVQILVPESIQVASLAQHTGGEAGAPPKLPQAAPVSAVATQPLQAPAGVRVATVGPAPLPHPPPPARLPPVVAPPPLPERVATVAVQATNIFVQAGAFARADNAERLKAKLGRFGPVKVSGARVNGVNLYRVRLGPLASLDDADRLLGRVIESGASEAKIVVD
jgi:rare lipoprotein A